MFPREPATLERDTAAIQIPDGTWVTLPKDSEVVITQQLGGSYTVMTQYGALYRIDPENADALGKEPPKRDTQRDDPSVPLDDRIWAQLGKCYDPEIPVNIVELGLVYDVWTEDEGGGQKRVGIKMTLTAPGCGMGPVLAQDVRRRVEEIPEIAHADVEIVLDPPWNQNMMSEAARLQLGFL